jgi:enoyl-CoA hydratase
MDLAGVCDITICSEDAVFGYPAVRYGDLPTCPIWPFLIGYKKFKEIVYTGRHISAKEMYDFGLINKVVPRENLEEEVELMAKTIALVPKTSIYFGKVYTNNLIEAMGMRTLLALMNASFGVVQTQPGEKQEFVRLVREKGLKEALRVRDTKFAEIDKASESLRARKYTK